jgi:GxxExxY protein
MTENEIEKIVVDTAIKVHMALGPGLLESVYEIILAHALSKKGLHVDRQDSYFWKGRDFGNLFSS